MSTKVPIQDHQDEDASFRFYYECFDEPIEFVYIEFGGVPFEVESSPYLSGNGPSHVGLRIPAKWAPDLILGFQKALVEAFVPIEVRNRAREVLGNEERARAWLIAKPIVTGGKTAVELCREGNADTVMYQLGIIEGEHWA